MQARSLHIGSREFWDAFYGTVLKDTVSCAEDARRLAALAAKRGFAATELIGVQALLSSIQRHVSDAATDLVSGDHYLLTFSGHGYAAYVNGTLVVGWCFFDDDLLRTELASMLGAFRSGVRVQLLVNCCYSGAASDGEAHPLTLPPGVVLYVASKHANLIDGRADVRLFDENVEAMSAAFGVLARTNAHVIEIDACSGTKTSPDGADPGRPTPFITHSLLEIEDDRYVGFGDFVSRLKVRCQSAGISDPQSGAFAPRSALFEAQGPYRR